MLWKMTNVVLQKGSVFPFYGDSAPFFKSVCHRKCFDMNFRWVFSCKLNNFVCIIFLNDFRKFDLRRFFYVRKKLIKAKRSFCHFEKCTSLRLWGHFEKWKKRINQRFLRYDSTTAIPYNWGNTPCFCIYRNWKSNTVTL